jgi:DNA-directed RNA polymerase specialized sigma24 family protein
MEPGPPDPSGEVVPPSGEPQLEFEPFFRRAYPDLVRGLTISWGPDIAADVVQEAFIRAHRHWSKVAALDSPTAWVRRVAVNLLVDDHRRRKFERRYQAFSGEEAWVPAHFDYGKLNRGGHFINVVARVRGDSSLEAMREEFIAMRQVPKDGPGNHVIADRHPLLALPFQADLVGMPGQVIGGAEQNRAAFVHGGP